MCRVLKHFQSDTAISPPERVTRWSNFSLIGRGKRFDHYYCCMSSTRFIIEGSKVIRLEGTSKPFSALSNLILNAFIPTCELHPFYYRYAGWRFVAGFLGSIMSMFAKRAMLRAVVGSDSVSLTHTTFLAAVTRWLIRDALGQVGGVMGMAGVGKLPDINPKAGRMISNILLSGSALVECTSAYWLPASPHELSWWIAFGALAIGTGIARNMAMTIYTASRAHQLTWLATKRSAVIGEMIARSTAQMTAASLLGTFVGIVAAFQSWMTQPILVVAVSALLVMGLISTRYACYYAWSARLERHRIPTLIEYLRTEGAVPTPEQFSLFEPIWHSQLQDLRIEPKDYPGTPTLEELNEALKLGILRRMDNGTTSIWFVHAVPTRTQIHSILSLVDLGHFMTELEGLGWDLSSADLKSKRSVHIMNKMSDDKA